jgi:ligand-binding sensor domain-containing protein
MRVVQVCALLMLVFCVASNAQNNNQPKDKTGANRSGTIGTVHEKVKKTQPTGNAMGENVHCGLRDQRGNLWFGTTGHGVFYYDGHSFTNFTEVDGLNSNFVWCILEDRNGNIFIGTGKGVSRFARQQEGQKKCFTDFTRDQVFGERAIWSLLEDVTGKIWIATDFDGTYYYDGKAFTLLPALEKNNKSGLKLNNLNGMAQDKDGNLWFASWQGEGLSKYDGQTIIRFTPEQGINDDMFHCVIQDRSGILWFGSRRHGVFRYDGNSFTQMADENGPANDCIYAIAEDSAGNIWFTTERNGVFRYDGKSFKQYLPDEVLPPALKEDLNFSFRERVPYNSVFSVVEDKDGNLWFGTRNVGLFRFDGKSFVNFSE